MSAETNTYEMTNKGSLGKNALIVGIIFIIVSAAGWFMDSEQFFKSYLLGYIFWLTLALGGLFFTMINHLFGSVWNVVLRRIGEATMYSFPVLAVLFIPILFGMHDLYHWTHEEDVLKDAILSAKAGYLNITFFTIRAVIYFALWFTLSKVLYNISLKQDKDPNEKYILRMRQISAPGMIIFALSITFASFDWIMSLEPHWFSTIYGVYFFAGCFLSILAFVVLAAQHLLNRGYLTDKITVEHIHDMGKLFFAFLIFWGYIGFSQYFLIWYANIPEETVYYLIRWENGWNYITMLLVAGHFTLPFFILLLRSVKRNMVMMRVIAIWILVMHVFDIFWLSRPGISHGHGPHFSWIDLTVLLGIGGIFIWNFWNNLTSHPLLPIGERRLEASVKFKV
jgi:hypothetical protein